MMRLLVAVLFLRNVAHRPLRFIVFVRLLVGIITKVNGFLDSRGVGREKWNFINYFPPGADYW